MSNDELNNYSISNIDELRTNPVNDENERRENHFRHCRSSNRFAFGIKQILEIEFAREHGDHARNRHPNRFERGVFRQQHVKGEQIAEPDKNVDQTKFQKG